MEIVITRKKLYPCPGTSYRFAWKWIYYFSIDGGRPMEYGTHLASLRGTLKRKYRGARVVEAWKVEGGESNA